MRQLSFFVTLLILINGYSYAQPSNPKKILIFGAGYIGTVSGVCLAHYGHKVTFIDTDEEKVRLLNDKKSPISEPKLEPLIRAGFEKGLLSAKSIPNNEIAEADIAFITVATPSSPEGIPQIEYVKKVLQLLEQRSKERTTPLIVSIRSTLLPHLFRELQQSYAEENGKLILVANPEFLRESTAVDDFFHPPFCVVGGDSAWAVDEVLSIYEDISVDCYSTSVEVACLLKYACNAFHALKITFSNEMATLCDTMKVNPVDLMNLFIKDTSLNCSSAYLKPGFSFGGSCLGKDLRALVTLKNDLEISLPLISSILPSNECRFQKFLKEILQHNHQTLAVFGMTFKKNSDDLRESPFVALIDSLHKRGIQVRIYDPDISLDRLSNPYWTSFSQNYKHIIDLVQLDLPTTLEGCDGVILCKDLLDSNIVQELQRKQIPLYDLGYFVQDKDDKF